MMRGIPAALQEELITKERPELRMQALTIALTVKSGDTLEQPVGPDTVAVVASNPSGQRVPISISGGAVSWTDGKAVEMWNPQDGTVASVASTRPKARSQ